MFIRSERLFLRPAWSEDASDLAQVLAAGVMSNVALAELTRDAGDASERISVLGKRRVLGMLITLPSACGSEVIGGVELECAAGDAPGDLRLGYWLAQHRWGHGYAAEAARSVLSLARALGYRRVFADQSVDDRASLLVLTRAGFRPTGEQRIDGERVAAVYVARIADEAGDDDANEVRAA